MAAELRGRAIVPRPARARTGRTLAKVEKLINRAEALEARGGAAAAAAQLRAAQKQLRGGRYRDLREALDDLADSLKRDRDDD